MTNRLFISLDLPEDIISKVITIRDEIYGTENPPKWENEKKLHFTLKFLGDVEESLNQQLVKLISEVAGKYSFFDLEFDKFGFFYKGKEPRILWLGIKSNESLNSMFFELEEALARLGFPKETRKFKPHLTLLRFRGKENMDKIKTFPFREISVKSFRAKSISLVKSVLLQSGSVYSQLGSYKF